MNQNNIKPQELRLGNYIASAHFPDRLVVVKVEQLREAQLIARHLNGTTEPMAYYGEIKPIPLSEEILLKCPQFKIDYADRGTNEEIKFFCFKLFPEQKYNDLELVSGDKNGKFEVFLFPYEDVRFEFLHQLQNVVSSLGKELEVRWT